MWLVLTSPHLSDASLVSCVWRFWRLSLDSPFAFFSSSSGGLRGSIPLVSLTSCATTSWRWSMSTHNRSVGQGYSSVEPLEYRWVLFWVHVFSVTGPHMCNSCYMPCMAHSIPVKSICYSYFMAKVTTGLSLENDAVLRPFWGHMVTMLCHPWHLKHGVSSILHCM